MAYMTGYSSYMDPEKELRDTRRQLRTAKLMSPGFSVKDLPFDFRAMDTKQMVGVCTVRDIKDKFFKRLNGHDVYPYKARVIEHNAYYNSGKVKGRVETVIPADCVAVRSNVILGLPGLYKPEDKRLQYLDYETLPNGFKVYIYVLPKENLWFNHRTAVIASNTFKRANYGGYKVTLLNGHTIYLSIVDFNPTLYEQAGINVINVSKGLIGTDYLDWLITEWSKPGIDATTKAPRPAICFDLDAYQGQFCVPVDVTLDWQEDETRLDEYLLRKQSAAQVGTFSEIDIEGLTGGGNE